MEDSETRKFRDIDWIRDIVSITKDMNIDKAWFSGNVCILGHGSVFPERFFCCQNDSDCFYYAVNQNIRHLFLADSSSIVFNNALLDYSSATTVELNYDAPACFEDVPDRYFNCITFFRPEVQSDFSEVIKEIHRVLAPNGIFIAIFDEPVDMKQWKWEVKHCSLLNSYHYGITHMNRYVIQKSSDSM